MGKTQEHSEDVQRKVVELLVVKATGDVKNQPGRGRVRTLIPHTLRRMVRVAKQYPRITAGELQKLPSDTTKTTIRHHLHHHKLFLRVAKSLCCQSTTN